jgi:chromosome segregation ATPase
LSALNESQGDGKYLEFVSELHRTVSSVAKLQTVSDVLDSKIAEFREVFALTKAKHANAESEFNQASDKYEELLRLVAEKKISHRDQISHLHLRIRNRRSATATNPEIQGRLSNHHQKMSEIRERGLELRSHAARLRMEYEESERENSQTQCEIESLTKAKDELGTSRSRFSQFPKKQKSERCGNYERLPMADCTRVQF